MNFPLPSESQKCIVSLKESHEKLFVLNNNQQFKNVISSHMSNYKIIEIFHRNIMENNIFAFPYRDDKRVRELLLSTNFSPINNINFISKLYFYLYTNDDDTEIDKILKKYGSTRSECENYILEDINILLTEKRFPRLLKGHYSFLQKFDIYSLKTLKTLDFWLLEFGQFINFESVTNKKLKSNLRKIFIKKFLNKRIRKVISSLSKNILSIKSAVIKEKSYIQIELKGDNTLFIKNSLNDSGWILLPNKVAQRVEGLTCSHEVKSLIKELYAEKYISIIKMIWLFLF